MGPAPTTSFDGFPVDGLDFLEELAADNSKTFFDTNRSRYDDGLLAPAKACVTELGTWLQRNVDPDVTADPRVNGSLFRINRDIRFSHDKSPYKTHLAMFFWLGDDKKRSPGFYVHLEPDLLWLGGGMIGGLDLPTWRAALDDPVTGPEFSAAVDRVAAAGELQLDEPDYKRVPKPFPDDHPRADWLRRKAVRMSHHHDIPNELHTAAAVEWLGRGLAPFAGVMRWLARLDPHRPNAT